MKATADKRGLVVKRQRGFSMKFAFGTVSAFVSALLLSPLASAALTVSEQAQVRSFVSAGQIANASRVRAMVARTDLTTEEK